MTCIGCSKSLPCDQFDLGQKVDQQCKKFFDRIYYQARVQGQLAWWAKQRKTDSGTKAMLDFYRNVSIAADEAGKFVVAQFKEIHVKENGVEIKGCGRMMWENQAVEFWMSTEGGSVSLREAQSRWSDWSTH